MKKIMVLGIGNQLMMDDGIGIYLAIELAKLECDPNIQYIVGESDIDYCLEQIEKAKFVLILDAVSSGEKPGELSIFPLESLDEFPSLDLSPHNLHLFQVLYHQKERIKGYLIGVEPYEINFNIGLSETLKEKWDIILHDTNRAIQNLIENEKS